MAKPSNHYTPNEEIMASINKLQDNYARLQRGTTEKYDQMTPKQVYAEFIKDLQTLKGFVADRTGVSTEFRG